MAEADSTRKEYSSGDLRYPKSSVGTEGYWIQLIGMKSTPVKAGLEEQTSSALAGGNDKDSVSFKMREALKGGLKSTTIGSVSLALSNGVSETSSHSWSDSNLTAGFGSGNQVNMAERVGTNVNQLVNVVSSIAKSFIGKVAPPIYVVQYNSSELRSFSFDVEFLPQSAEESAEIRKIILTLKAWASPKGFDGKDTFDQPLYVQPKLLFNTSDNSYVDSMIYFNLCVIESININYFDGNTITYLDGMPKKMRATINLKEIAVNYRGDYEDALEKLSNPIGSLESNVTNENGRTTKTESINF